MVAVLAVAAAALAFAAVGIVLMQQTRAATPGPAVGVRPQQRAPLTIGAAPGIPALRVAPRRSRGAVARSAPSGPATVPTVVHAAAAPTPAAQHAPQPAPSRAAVPPPSPPPAPAAPTPAPKASQPADGTFDDAGSDVSGDFDSSGPR